METRWPHVEERIRGVLDAMVAEAGFMPSGYLRDAWIAGARDFVNNVGEHPELVAPAIRQMQKAGLIIKSPRSLIAVALKMNREPDNQSYAGRQRYADSLRRLYGEDE